MWPLFNIVNDAVLWHGKCAYPSHVRIECGAGYGPGDNGQSGWAKPQLTKPKTI